MTAAARGPARYVSAGALAVAATLSLVGCGATPGTQAPSPGTSSATPSDEPTATPSVTISGVDPDQQFSLDDIAQFPDGLEFSTAGASVEKATSTQRGAEATNGQIVVVSILITNHSKQAYDPRSAFISAAYGPQHTPAAMITDSAADLTTGFDAPIAAGDEGTAAVGFAIPDAGLDQVSIIVDPNDEVNSAMSFSGKVEKAS